MSKQALMNDLLTEIKQCHRCRLWQQARNSVPGEGNLDADLMFVGEAPGHREDITGRPFVGAAGKLLDDLLSIIDLKRSDIYIGNIVKHRPPKNRNPRKDEIETCVPYLDRQIQIIRPKIIITLGRHSTRYILSKMNISVDGISTARGRIYRGKFFTLPVRVIPTFHPAAILYNPKTRSRIEEDFQRIKKEIQ